MTTARAQHGFTLPELLVAMSAGLVVLFALSGIMIATLHQTQRTFTRADATRQARTAMATIENELHSACVSSNVAPVLAGSTATTLKFISYNGSAATPTPTSQSVPVWHELSLTGTKLTDATYNATLQPTGGYTRDATTPVKTVTLLTNVSAQSGADPFQYYAYAQFSAPDGGLY